MALPLALHAPAVPLPAAPTVPVGWAVAAVLLAVAPFVALTPFASGYDAQRVLGVAVWVGLAGALAVSVQSRAAWVETWGRVPRLAAAGVLAIVALGVASAALAPRPAYAFAEVASFVLVGVGAVAAASAGRAGARAGMAFTSVLALGGYAAVVFPLHLADAVAGAPDVWPFRHLGFANVRHYNQLQAWALPVVWALAASARTGWGRAALRAVGAASVALLVASNGRSIVVALGAGVAAALVAAPDARRAFAREVAVSVGLGLALGAALFSGAPTALDRVGDGANGRSELWAGALRMVAADPWLGAGPMHFVYHPTPAGAHPHNVVLQVAAEWGVPAAVLGVGLVLAGLAGWARAARRTPSAGALVSGVPADALWTAGLTAALVAALANAMFDGFLVAPTSQAVAALGLGAVLAEGLPASGRRGTRWAGHAVLAVALPSAAVLLGVAASDGPRLWRRHYDARSVAVGPQDVPRFWNVGQIAGRLPPDHARVWPELYAQPPAP